ncbi:hypothetical protein LNKW23_47200 [Paralimibaculum aggregatum]|uniref:Uncharacterized protein n=1 Tax=Paralimibaculum aggregatum TaxID=3036245 RepID=A0ABQ6LTV4_9RHOB|nr:hypothetical protein LNKW23_47200 [Limibaculum sp. NKW23]
MAAIAQLGMDPRRPVAALAGLEDPTDLLYQLRTPCSALGSLRAGTLPSVVPAPRNAEHPTEKADGVFSGMGDDKGELGLDGFAAH